ncbi:cytochrome c biogenesis protein ResB, partial [Candidatus Bipolaricaulota bacterium]|nr:cytochrome c biogenesis protein ResB [Candidatus Bipolaricaulota bacterium]
MLSDLPVSLDAIRHGVLRTVVFLGSLRLAVVLLVLITLAAVVGGVLPQASITPNANEIYHAYGVFWYRLITRLSLDDVFHSGWFLALISLLALNLTLCTSRRVRRSLGRAFGRPHYAIVSEEEAGTHWIPLKQVERDPAPAIAQLLRRRGYPSIDCVASPEDRTSELQIVARRWRWGALAPDLVHAGILIILAGALLGTLRQEGTFVVNEWEKGLLLP